MKYKIIILHQATLDFKEGKKWYKETLVNGLSQRFSHAVRGTIFNLQNNPTAYAIRYKKVSIAH